MDRKRLHGSTVNRGANTNESVTLIITRLLGHKTDMPGSGQWKIINDTKKQEECWICGLNKYSLLFWSEFAQADAKLNYNSQLEALIIAKLMELQEKPLPETQEAEAPLIFGDFNDWKPEPMVEILDF